MIASMHRSAPLGRLLVDTGVLTHAQLDEVLVAQRTDKRRLGELLVERGLVTGLELAQLLSRQLSCPWISLVGMEIPADVIAALPREAALENQVVPVHLRASNRQRALYVATDDPSDDIVLAKCAAEAGIIVRPMVAITSEIRDALTRYYGAPAVPAPAPAKLASPPPPPLPAKPKPTRISSSRMAAVLEDTDVLEIIDFDPPAFEKRAPNVLVLNAPPAFLEQCRASAASLGARVVDGAIVSAAELVEEHRPCAIVVTDDVYAFDRTGLNRLALDNDAHLVVWSEEVDGRQLEPLLAGAIDRWGRSSYEKGAIVDGRYELLRDLGEQAFGSRWEVRNVRTARRSVLALAVRAENEEAARAVRREHRALARVLHPGAVELRDAGTTELGDPYVVLEPLEGRTQGGLLAARGKLPVEDAAAIAVQVADVLAAAHAASVSHGDVTAETILVVRDPYGAEHVKLTGWNRAVVRDVTPAHLRGDVRALAACTYEAVTGRPARAAADLASLQRPLASILARALGTESPHIDTASELAAAMASLTASSAPATRLLDASPDRRDAAAAAPSSTRGPEERRHARAPYRTPVRIELPGKGAVDGKSEDISAGGLLIVTRGGLVPGASVTLRFALPLDGKVVAEPAIVKWSRASRSDESSGLSAVGVELTSPGAETQRQIERYVTYMGEGDT